MKTIYIRHFKTVVAGACAAVLAVILLTGGNNVQPAVALSGIKPIYSVDTNQKAVALSFDAAWGADKTSAIMDILDAHGCSATFFLVGFWVDKYPEKVKEISDRGFEIGNHSDHHPRMSTLSGEQIKQELTLVNNKIAAITGKAPTVFRPPFGDYSDAVVSGVNASGMHCVQWSIDSLDWKEISVQDTVERVTKNVKAGDIILFHNNSKYILDALPQILDFLQRKGLKGVNVSGLIYTDGYTVDNNGIQHRA